MNKYIQYCIDNNILLYSGDFSIKTEAYHSHECDCEDSVGKESHIHNIPILSENFLQKIKRNMNIELLLS